jgi:hypothetical protein
MQLIVGTSGDPLQDSGRFFLGIIIAEFPLSVANLVDGLVFVFITLRSD